MDRSYGVASSNDRAKMSSGRKAGKRNPSVHHPAPRSAPAMATPRTTRQNLPATDLTKCLICQETKRDKRKRRLTESLTQCLTFEAEYSLLNAAKSRGNERVVKELDGRDAIALEVRYHRTYYQDFTHKK